MHFGRIVQRSAQEGIQKRSHGQGHVQNHGVGLCLLILYYSPIQCGRLIAGCASPAPRPRALPSRKHFRRAHVRSKIAHPKNMSFFYRFSIKRIQALAFNVLLVRGSITELVALQISENRAPARDILKISRFSDFIDYQKLRSRARQFDFFDVWMMFVSSKIALPLETSSKFRRFIFIKIDQNCAPVRSIQKILIIDER